LKKFNQNDSEQLLVRNSLNSIQEVEEKSENSNKKNSSTWISSYEQKFSHLDKSVFFSSKADSINSILVRTGVFQGDLNDTQAHNSQLVLAHKDMTIDVNLIRPKFVLEDVHEAVKLIFSLENHH
jgi:hypothetical protein